MNNLKIYIDAYKNFRVHLESLNDLKIRVDERLDEYGKNSEAELEVKTLVIIRDLIHEAMTSCERDIRVIAQVIRGIVSWTTYRIEGYDWEREFEHESEVSEQRGIHEQD